MLDLYLNTKQNVSSIIVRVDCTFELAELHESTKQEISESEINDYYILLLAFQFLSILTTLNVIDDNKAASTNSLI